MAEAEDTRLTQPPAWYRGRCKGHGKEDLLGHGGAQATNR